MFSNNIYFYMRNLIKKIRILQKSSIKPHTDEWYNVRDKKISATNISSIIGIDNYKTSEQLLNDKIYGLNIIDNKYTKHGNMFEDIAIRILEKKLDINVMEVGFKLSDKYNFLGATPDGITVIGDELLLIEIKCPLTRKISGIPSFNYYCQMQTQLEVYEINKCLFFECNLKEITKKEYNELKREKYQNLYGYNQKKNIYWKLLESSLNIIEKDEEFINTYIGDLKNFNYHLKNELSLKRRKITYERINTKKHIKNYLSDNKFDTWMNIYGNKYYKEYYDDNMFSKEILKKSIEKKRIFLDIIKKKCYNNQLKLVVLPTYHKKNNYLLDLTKKYMNEEYDVIINPYFYDNDLNLYSNPTMIVKNDKLNSLFGIINNKNKGYTLINKVVKNIKYINNGENLSNNETHKYIKTNNNYDNYILNKNQDISNYISYVIGEKWNYLKDKKKITSETPNDFSKLGIIKYESLKNFKIELIKYNKWLNDIIKDDNKYDIMNNKKYTPYALNNEQSNWIRFKKQILKNRNDVSLMYNIGKVTKQKLNVYGVYSWKDPKFRKLVNSEILGISDKNKNIINNILDLNENEDNLIYPIKSNKMIKNDLKRNKLEIYCDFETLNNFLGNENLIYLIGMTIKYPNNEIKYEYFLANKNTNEQEKYIVDKFIDKINELEDKYNMDAIVYCWSKAEDVFIKHFNKKNNLTYNINFTDLLEILKNNSILVKNNIYGFGLKNYVESMYEHKMIDKNYKDGDCDSGDKSIINALKYYNEKDEKSLNDLIKYNEIDCTIMYEILEFFRKYYEI